MDLFSFSYSFLFFTLHVSLLFFSRAAFGAKFTFVNKCEYTVWPGILANAGSPKLDSTGFELAQGSSRTFVAPSGWSGRFWGRTGCTFSGSGAGSCQTGDCGSGEAECNGSGAAPPATLAEFTLATGGLDFYDVSLVDGYNLPMIVEATGGSGMCASTGCITDLNQACPAELRVGGGAACKSACEAFGNPQYCCSGDYNTPATCRPNVYSQMFKIACPRSYSYAYDDPTSTFTCSAADYSVTFCPSTPSQKSSKDPEPIVTTPPGTATTTNTGGSTSTPTPTLPGSDTTGTDGPGSGSGLGVTGSEYGSSDSGSDSQSGSEAMLADGSWMAEMAMGGSSSSYACPSSIIVASFQFLLVLSVLIQYQ